MSGPSERERSSPVIVRTPRGPVRVARQEMRGLRHGSDWRWFWMARRENAHQWFQATTAREAIRRAVTAPPRAKAAWLDKAAAEAEQLAGARR